MATRTPLSGYADLSIAAILVGSSFVAAKSLTDVLPIFVTNAIRFTIAAAAITPFMIRHRGRLQSIHGRDMRRMVLLSLIGVFLFNVFLFLGLRHMSAGTSGIITSFSPIVLAALACVLLNEPMTLNKALAIAVASAGVLVVNLQATGMRNFSWLGFALIFGVVLCEAAFTLLAKSVSTHVSPELMSAIVVYVSLVLFLPLGAWQLVHTSDVVIRAQDWLLLAYLGAVVNVVAYLLWYSGLRTTTAAEAAVFTGIIPISALALGHAFLDEPVGIADGFGLVLVLTGVLLITKPTQDAATGEISH